MKCPAFLRRVTALEFLFAITLVGLVASLLTITRTHQPDAQTRLLAKARAELRVISAALGAHQLDGNPLPDTEAGLAALVMPPLSEFPGAVPGLFEVPIDPWERPYQWRNPGRERPEELFSLGPDGIESGDDVRAWNPY